MAARRDMDLNDNIRNNIQQLRKVRNITQEVLAISLDISVQAISKWETGISLPDIMQLPRIAQFFGVSIDYLFFHEKKVEVTTFEEQYEIPNDEIIRVIQFRGKQMLSIDQWEKDKEIMLRLPDNLNENLVNKEIHIVIWGNGNIKGNINGYVEGKGTINCGNVKGYAESTGMINCGNIEGYAESKGNINCGNVNSYVEAGGSVNCENILGAVDCGGNLTCGEIMSNVNCKGNIKCSGIQGKAE